ncbi:MAG TPA: radical SAM protein, partial [Methanothrix sp.]|nr:radical SAM protein [Methanothrix sp.]
MRVNLGGIVPLSTVDWAGRAAMVVFLQGCPLRCPHCQNRRLQSGERYVPLHYIVSRIVSEVKGLPGPSRSALFSEGLESCSTSCHTPVQIKLDEAAQRAISKPFVDALVLSGGEPLLQPQACRHLFRLAKSLDLATGLETSGIFPDHLEMLLEEGLVDRVFLDLKSALEEPDYESATGRGHSASEVRKSLEICFKSGSVFEARTTVFPHDPSTWAVEEIAGALCRLKGSYPLSRLEGLILQQGHPGEDESPFSPVSIEEMEQMAEACRAASQGEMEIRVHALPKVVW